ncbi:hypothetical protein E2C01_002609 [Portunus trituberculatus]|uniref:Sushi domain-containing protein n=1 Tax=Portunus trituberculatus TaxID=210409 RepID=A0A5B7CML6_PORTR|nr:hypothetical protein [Portunus trituberculatus]
MHLNGTITFTCPPTTTTQSLATNQTLTCTTENVTNTFFYEPQTVEACDVCQETPSAVNATTSWSVDTIYTTGMEVVVTCFESHAFNLSGSPDQTISCLETGWSVPLPCYKGRGGGSRQGMWATARLADEGHCNQALHAGWSLATAATAHACLLPMATTPPLTRRPPTQQDGTSSPSRVYC